MPALLLMQELLKDKYTFDDEAANDTRNENDLETIAKRKITLPMSLTISNALLAALETTFGPKISTSDPRKTVKKPWPGPWAMKQKKALYTQNISPLRWTGKYFADEGLKLPHSLDPPATAVFTKTYKDIEGEVRHLQRGLHAASAVDVALQATQALLTKDQLQLSELKNSLAILTKFARYANFYSQTIPLSLVIQHTAQLREKALNSFRVTPKDAEFTALMRSPFVNSGLFPGCSEKLHKAVRRHRRAFSFYSRAYNSTPNSANRGFRGRRHAGQRQRNRGAGRPNNSFRPRPTNPQTQQSQRGMKGPRARSVSAGETMPQSDSLLVPAVLLREIELREAETVGACLLGPQALWASKGASSWMQNVLRYGYRPTIPISPPLTTRPPFVNHNKVKQAQLDDIVEQLLKKQVVTCVDNACSSPGVYSYLFLRPKKTGGNRPVFNMKPLNQFVKKESFQMETPAIVAASVRANSWACSLDLTDAYLHVPMHASIQHLLRFTNANQVYQFRALPFGLNVSAWILVVII
jgi:hypothetical protein